VLSPELGAHLGDAANLGPLGQPGGQQGAIGGLPHLQEHPEEGLVEEGGSTSGVSTSTAGHPTGGGHQLGQGAALASLSRLREENRQLLTDLVSAQNSYQELLKQSLADQRLHLQHLSQSLAASHLQSPGVQLNSPGVQFNSPGLQLQSPLQSPAAQLASESTGNRDEQLVEWLERIGLNTESIEFCMKEDLTLSDVLELMTRDDLKRLGLKAGPELRIWRAILLHRNVPLTPTP